MTRYRAVDFRDRCQYIVLTGVAYSSGSSIVSHKLSSDNSSFSCCIRFFLGVSC